MQRSASFQYWGRVSARVGVLVLLAGGNHHQDPVGAVPRFLASMARSTDFSRMVTAVSSISSQLTPAFLQLPAAPDPLEELVGILKLGHAGGIPVSWLLHPFETGQDQLFRVITLASVEMNFSSC
jgi:hypothetical protein